MVQEVRKGVLILGSEESFELLKHHSAEIFGDDTLRYAPKTYKQMYNLHIFQDTMYIPVVYFLL